MIAALAELPARAASVREHGVAKTRRFAPLSKRGQPSVERSLLPAARTACFLARGFDRGDRLEMRELPVSDFLHERERASCIDRFVADCRCILTLCDVPVEILQHI